MNFFVANFTLPLIFIVQLYDNLKIFYLSDLSVGPRKHFLQFFNSFIATSCNKLCNLCSGQQEQLQMSIRNFVHTYINYWRNIAQFFLCMKLRKLHANIQKKTLTTFRSVERRVILAGDFTSAFYIISYFNILRYTSSD